LRSQFLDEVGAARRNDELRPPPRELEGRTFAEAASGVPATRRVGASAAVGYNRSG
jgi:hypothetical protein